MSATQNPQAYAPGTYWHKRTADSYGKGAADWIYSVALSGGDVGAAFDKLSTDTTGSSWWLANFTTQITTDPLAAPLESANNVIGNSVWSFLRNPWVMLAIAVAVWGWLGFPGLKSLTKKFA